MLTNSNISQNQAKPNSRHQKLYEDVVVILRRLGVVHDRIRSIEVTIISQSPTQSCQPNIMTKKHRSYSNSIVSFDVFNLSSFVSIFEVTLHLAILIFLDISFIVL